MELGGSQAAGTSAKPSNLAAWLAEREQLKEAVRQREELLFIAVHEVRSPLSALLVQVQLAQQALQPRSIVAMSGDAVTDLLAGAEQQVQRICQLMDTLLDAAQIGAGVTMERQQVDLGAVVRDVLARLSPEAAQAKVAISVRTTQPVVGRWDPLRLEQIVTNLLANAIKYGAGQPVVVSFETQEGRVRLSVSDRGIGIAPEDQARIFQRFERAAPGGQGLGLGLYIVQTLVEAMGGAVQVHSRPGEGATFTVELPLAR